ncbi:MAG: LrgB family protein [Bacteroidota bacterium]|nr:LrgB family protein [Bacteroidota bacterium]MDP4204947.1 LrgB family protein [Bacteroidota bacterium]
MKEIISSPLFHLTITLLFYILMRKLYIRFNYSFLNPILLTIVGLIVILYVTGIPYEAYSQNTKIISFWLGPSVVALGLPLYLNLRKVKKEIWKILLAMTTGSIAGIVSVVLIAWSLGGSREVMLSLAPKSVTTPIAMEISHQIGGIPPLTAAIVITVGIFGAMFGMSFMKLLRIKDPKAIGLGVGAASHGVGTAWISHHGREYSAFGGLGMALNGILTALFTPSIVHWMLNWLH